MIILENYKLDNSKYSLSNDVYFIRVDPESLSVTINELIMELHNMSWICKLNSKFLVDSFKSRAIKTSLYLERKLLDKHDTTDMKNDAGEYIVSSLSKRALVEGLNHNDIPLMELLGRKKSNNPGFDFYTENNKMLTVGEAKYICERNAYNSSLKQIFEFLEDNKHIDDIALLCFFSSSESIDNLDNNIFNVCAAFSSTNIESSKLIENIVSNEHFRECNQLHDVYLVAVNMYEE